MSRVCRRSSAALILTAGIVVTWLLRPAPPPKAPFDNAPIVTESEESSPPLLSRDEEAGRLVFERHCVVCHGRTGDGFGINAPNLPLEVPDLTSSTNVSAWNDVLLFERIARGADASTRPPICPAWERHLTPRNIDALVAFLRQLSRGARADRRAPAH